MTIEMSVKVSPAGSRRNGYLVTVEGGAVDADGVPQPGSYVAYDNKGARIDNGNNNAADAIQSCIDNLGSNKKIAFDVGQYNIDKKIAGPVNKKLELSGVGDGMVIWDASAVGNAVKVFECNSGAAAIQDKSRTDFKGIVIDRNNENATVETLDFQFSKKWSMYQTHVINSRVGDARPPAVGSIGVNGSPNDGEKQLMLKCTIQGHDKLVRVNTDWLWAEHCHLGYSRTMGFEFTGGLGGGLGNVLRDIHFFRCAGDPIVINGTSTSLGRQLLIDGVIDEGDVTITQPVNWAAIAGRTSTILHNQWHGYLVRAVNVTLSDLAAFSTPPPPIVSGAGAMNVHNLGAWE